MWFANLTDSEEGGAIDIDGEDEDNKALSDGEVSAHTQFDEEPMTYQGAADTIEEDHSTEEAIDPIATGPDVVNPKPTASDGKGKEKKKKGGKKETVENNKAKEKAKEKLDGSKRRAKAVSEDANAL